MQLSVTITGIMESIVNVGVVYIEVPYVLKQDKLI